MWWRKALERKKKIQLCILDCISRLSCLVKELAWTVNKEWFGGNSFPWGHEWRVEPLFGWLGLPKCYGRRAKLFTARSRDVIFSFAKNHLHLASRAEEKVFNPWEIRSLELIQSFSNQLEKSIKVDYYYPNKLAQQFHLFFTCFFSVPNDVVLWQLV